MYKLILASTSVYRKKQMAKFGLAFEAIAPNLDEEPYKQQGLTPQQLAATLSQLKAESVFLHSPKAIIIGGDQVAEIQGKTLSKPKTHDLAIQQLLSLQGRTHSLWTGLYLCHPEKGPKAIMVQTQLTMRALNQRQIESYLYQDRPYDCAGSYKFEENGFKLFEKVDTTDFSAIQGVPMLELGNQLSGWGFSLFL